MPYVDLNGLRCYYRLEGSADKPVIVFCHALGLDHGMFEPQMSDVTASFRVLRYDIRGHGATDAPVGEYTMDQLGTDARVLLDRLNIDRVVWCGVSIGGMIGQWLAANAGGRLSALVLSNTSPRVADPAAMEARRNTVLADGLRAVADTAMTRFFGKAAHAEDPVVSSARTVFLGTSPIGYAGCCAALRDADLHPLLERIQVRTLVVSGDRDESMPWTGHGAVLAGRIAGAAAVRLPTAHLSNLGAPRAFTRAVLAFLAPPEATSPEAGMAVRRQVLGDAHVDRSMASVTDLTRNFQALITRFPWAAIWTRPGLDLRTRRLLVLAITASLGRWEEFRLHLSAGIDHGLEWSDVEEVLLQTSAYAGIPVGNTAFKIAEEERVRRQETT